MGRPRKLPHITASPRPDEVKMARAVEEAIRNGSIKNEQTPSQTMQEFLVQQRDVSPGHANLLEQIVESGLRPNEVEAMAFSDYCWFTKMAKDADNAWDQQQWAKLAQKALASLAVLTRGKVVTKRNPKMIQMVMGNDGVLDVDDAGDEIPTD